MIVVFYGDLRIHNLGGMFPPNFELSRIISIPLTILVIVGVTNAINLSDGLDGLAGGICLLSFICLGYLSYRQGFQDPIILSVAIIGAIIGFLRYNTYPASIFMGDTGSLAIGAALATLALMTGQWLVLPIIAIIPVSEIISVILQIAYFKITKGKRLFKMSPIHHHFELLGWSETQVVQRFWLVSLMAAMIGIAIIFME